MNKCLLSALISATLSANALAASLDVHGEIKVNGTTVIDENGLLIAQHTGLQAFSVSEYLGSVGVILHQENTNTGWEDDVFVEELIITKGEDGSFGYEVYDNNQVVWKYQETPTDNGYSYVNGPNLDTCSGVVTRNTAVSLPDNLQLGLSYAELTTENNVGSCSYGEVNSTNEDRVIFTVIATTNYQLEASSLEQCILVKESSYNSYSWGEEEADLSISQYNSLLTFCKNVGLVDIISDGFRMKTTRVETLSAPSSRSATIASPKVDYRKLMKASKINATH